MNHVLGNVAAGILPEQAPVDELVGIESLLRAVREEQVPANVVGVAVGWDGAHPLAFAARCVAAHPRLHHRQLAQLA